ncbi:MAG: serine hydrolase [Cellulosilyticum sp.]|nr:serine hydrolase [Cellulosilyticum sp.]
MHLKAKMEQVISESYQNSTGVVVRKGGHVIYENYWNDSTRDTKNHIFSVTKSIVSTLIGIALDKKLIQSVDQKILGFFPEYSVVKGEENIQEITIRDLLTMTAPYKYEHEDFEAYFSSEDWVNAALDLLGGSPKGTFRYTPIIGPDILCGILTQVTGKSVLDFAKEELFGPLEIKVDRSIIFQSVEEQLAFYNEKNINGWVAGLNGVNTAGWGLNLTAMDMAKIGQLYLNDGMWQDKQIVSKAWINESTSKQSFCEAFQLSYGYLWWIIDEEEGSFAAVGDGGNVIYVNAKKDMVIALTSLFVPNAEDRIQLIKEYIEPAFS